MYDMGLRKRFNCTICFLSSGLRDFVFWNKDISTTLGKQHFIAVLYLDQDTQDVDFEVVECIGSRTMIVNESCHYTAVLLKQQSTMTESRARSANLHISNKNSEEIYLIER